MTRTTRLSLKNQVAVSHLDRPLEEHRRYQSAPHTYTVVRQTVRNVDLRRKLLIRRLRRPVESGFALYRSQDSRLSCSTSIGIQLKMVNTLPFDSAMPTHYLRHSFDDKKFDLQTMEGIMFLTVQIDYSNE